LTPDCHDPYWTGSKGSPETGAETGEAKAAANPLNLIRIVPA